MSLTLFLISLLESKMLNHVAENTGDQPPFPGIENDEGSVGA
jgi:hypothetical protein